MVTCYISNSQTGWHCSQILLEFKSENRSIIAGIVFKIEKTYWQNNVPMRHVYKQYTTLNTEVQELFSALSRWDFSNRVATVLEIRENKKSQGKVREFKKERAKSRNFDSLSI